VLAVLVGPAVAVRRHARSPGAAMIAGAVVAAAAGIAGIQMSALAGTAAGASVALVLCAAAALGAVLPVRRSRAAARASGPPRAPFRRSASRG
jgi:ABC-type Mn2+/Zn2+ transport system permease subunit